MIDQAAHDRAAQRWATIEQEAHNRTVALWESLTESERVEVTDACEGGNVPTHLVARFVHGGVHPIAGFWPSVESGPCEFPMPESMIDYLVEIGNLDAR
jgi:hypothetical protein